MCGKDFGWVDSHIRMLKKVNLYTLMYITEMWTFSEQAISARKRISQYLRQFYRSWCEGFPLFMKWFFLFSAGESEKMRKFENDEWWFIFHFSMIHASTAKNEYDEALRNPNRSIRTRSGAEEEETGSGVSGIYFIFLHTKNEFESFQSSV